MRDYTGGLIQPDKRVTFNKNRKFLILFASSLLDLGKVSSHSFSGDPIHLVFFAAHAPQMGEVSTRRRGSEGRRGEEPKSETGLPPNPSS
jgi:hypothetical protein